MKLEYLYIVRPNEEFQRLLRSKLEQPRPVSEVVLLNLLTPEVWKRAEGDMSPLSTQHKKAQVKLMFLNSLKHQYRYYRRKPEAFKDSMEQFEQLFGTDLEISQASFDRYWTIERTNRSNVFEEEELYLRKDDLDDFITDGTPIIEKWIKFLIARMDLYGVDDINSSHGSD